MNQDVEQKRMTFSKMKFIVTENPPTFEDGSLFTLFEKQSKNRNETGSSLSLDTRLTLLAKRLGRKRCCDTTPDCCLERNRPIIVPLNC